MLWLIIIIFSHQVEAAVQAAEGIGYPVMVRAAYALGGLGSGLCDNEKVLRETCTMVNNVAFQKFVRKTCS